MRMTIGIVLATLVTVSSMATAVSVTAVTDDVLQGVLEPGRYIVGFHEMIDPSSGEYAGEQIVDVSENLRFVTLAVTNPVGFQARVEADPNVAYYEVEGTASIAYTPNDSFWGVSDYTWGFTAIKANIAWDTERGTTATKICVLDTGLLKSHEEFSGQSRIAQGWDFVYEDNNPNDGNGHGTHVTGIIGATINNAKGIPGMAQSTIIPIRVLNSAGSGTHTDIAQGIDYCRTQGGHFASMSLSGGHSTTMQNAVVAAQNAGVLIIAAVGNDGCACTVYPAGYSSVVGVAAVDINLNKASFSNTGSAVDISAPGVRIVSTYKNIGGCTTNKCYVYLDGTSMATPFVAGVAGLVKSENPSMTASQVSSRLTSTAQYLGSSSSYGAGLVRADSAVY